MGRTSRRIVSTITVSQRSFVDILYVDLLVDAGSLQACQQHEPEDNPMGEHRLWDPAVGMHSDEWAKNDWAKNEDQR